MSLYHCVSVVVKKKKKLSINQCGCGVMVAATTAFGNHFQSINQSIVIDKETIKRIGRG